MAEKSPQFMDHMPAPTRKWMAGILSTVALGELAPAVVPTASAEAHPLAGQAKVEFRADGHLQPAEHGTPLAAAARNHNVLSTTGPIPAEVLKQERRYTGSSVGLAGSVSLFDKVDGHQNAAVTAHQLLYDEQGKREIYTGSNGQYYLVIPEGADVSLGNHMGTDPHKKHYLRAIIPNSNNFDIAILLDKGVKPKEAMAEYKDQFMSKTEIEKHHVGEKAYLRAFSLYGKYLPQPGAGGLAYTNTPKAPRRSQSFTTELESLGHVSTDKAQDVAAVSMLAPNTILDNGQPIGGASGAIIWSYNKKTGEVKRLAVADAVNLIKNSGDGSGSLKGQEKTTVLYGAYEAPPAPISTHVSKKVSASKLVNIVRDTSEIPGYIAPAKKAELAARAEALDPRYVKQEIKGLVTLPGVGWVNNAVVFPDFDSGYVTVGYANPNDPSGEDMSFKTYKVDSQYSEFILNALPAIGSNEVTLNELDGVSLGKDNFDPSVGGFKIGDEVIGNHTDQADYTQEPFMVGAVAPKNGQPGHLYAIPNKYVGIQN
jgi:hypothetical protein